MIAGEVTVKPAPRRQHAREASAVEAACVQLRDVAPNMMILLLRQRRFAAKYYQSRNVAPVIQDGMRA